MSGVVFVGRGTLCRSPLAAVEAAMPGIIARVRALHG